MGLFGNKIARSGKEAQVVDKLRESALLRTMMQEITSAMESDDYLWLTSSQGFTDEGQRSVVITTEGVQFFRCPLYRLGHVDLAVRSTRHALNMCFLMDSEKMYQEARKRHDRAQAAMDILSEVECLRFFYEDYGFEPLPDDCDEAGNILLNQRSVLRLWAHVLQERMEEMCTAMIFPMDLQNMQIENQGPVIYVFSYEVPSETQYEQTEPARSAWF